MVIKLRLRREELSPTFAEDDRDSIKDVAYLVGEALTRAAAALQDSILNEAPLLENIGLYRPPLTGIDMELYRYPMRRQKLAESIRMTVCKASGGQPEMMYCPYCKSAAHTKSSRYMSEQVKERYHQCTNLDCSFAFKTNESITKVITAPPQPEKIPVPSPEPPRERQTLGRYGSAFRQIH